MKPLQFILTALLLGSMTLTGCQSGGFRDWTETGSAQAFATSLGPVTRTEATAESRDAVQQLRTYTDTAGCTVYMGRIQPQGAACEGQTAAQYVLPGAEGTVRSYSAETGQWSVTPLEIKCCSARACISCAPISPKRFWSLLSRIPGVKTA